MPMVLSKKLPLRTAREEVRIAKAETKKAFNSSCLTVCFKLLSFEWSSATPRLVFFGGAQLMLNAG